MSSVTQNSGIMEELRRFTQGTKELVSFWSHVGLMYFSLKMTETFSPLNCYQDTREYVDKREDEFVVQFN